MSQSPTSRMDGWTDGCVKCSRQWSAVQWSRRDSTATRCANHSHINAHGCMQSDRSMISLCLIAAMPHSKGRMGCLRRSTGNWDSMVRHHLEFDRRSNGYNRFDVAGTACCRSVAAPVSLLVPHHPSEHLTAGHFGSNRCGFLSDSFSMRSCFFGSSLSMRR